MKRHFITIAGILAFLFFGAFPSYALQYSITDLGFFSSPNFGSFVGTPWISYKINNNNQIAGHSPEGAFLWENGKITDLGNANIGGINDNGALAGHDAEGIFVWENGMKRYVNKYPFGADSSYYQMYTQVFDINDLNQIAGFQIVQGQYLHAFLWENSDVIPIAPYSSSLAMATSVNDFGQTTVLLDELRTAFLWENGILTELNTLGGYWSLAWDINNRGQIAGEAQTADGLSHAALWENSMITDIGGLEGYAQSSAWAINESGQAVGSSFNDIYMFSDSSAFYWDREIGMINLNDYVAPDSGWQLAWASDINDLGYIVGVGFYNGETRGFLATPTPEPATMILLGTGLIGLAGIRRKSGRHPAVQNT